MDEPRSSIPDYSRMSNIELIEYASRRSSLVPIDMDTVAIGLGAAIALLRGHDSAQARERLIGFLLLLEALLDDMRQPSAPRAEDGDVIFANRSWVPGKAVEAIARALIAAQGEARKQREDALERAGLGDLAVHDHRRDTREDPRVDSVLRT